MGVGWSGDEVRSVVGYFGYDGGCFVVVVVGRR